MSRTCACFQFQLLAGWVVGWKGHRAGEIWSNCLLLWISRREIYKTLDFLAKTPLSNWSELQLKKTMGGLFLTFGLLLSCSIFQYSQGAGNGELTCVPFAILKRYNKGRQNTPANSISHGWICLWTCLWMKSEFWNEEFFFCRWFSRGWQDGRMVGCLLGSQIRWQLHIIHLQMLLVQNNAPGIVFCGLIVPEDIF